MKAIQYISITAAAAALLAFSAPVPAFSQMKDMSMKGHGHEQGHGQMTGMCSMDKMGDMIGMCIEHADKIGISDDQLAKMKPLHREMQKKHVRYNADLKIAEIELMEIMEVKNFDLEKAGTAVKKIGEIKTAHHLEMVKDMKEMRTMLTDEQFKNMKKMHMKTGEKKHTRRMIKK